MSGVLVFGEASGGRLHPMSLEVLQAGRALADGLGLPLATALVSAAPVLDAELFSTQGLDDRWICASDALAPYRADACADAARRIIDEVQPAAVLLAAGASAARLRPDCGGRR